MFIDEGFGPVWYEPSEAKPKVEERWGEEEILSLNDPGAIHYVFTRLHILLYEHEMFGREY